MLGIRNIGLIYCMLENLPFLHFCRFWIVESDTNPPRLVKCKSIVYLNNLRFHVAVLQLCVIVDHAVLTAVIIVTFIRARLLYPGNSSRRIRFEEKAAYRLFKVNAPCNPTIFLVRRIRRVRRKYILKGSLGKREGGGFSLALMPAEDTLTTAIKRIEYKTGCICTGIREGIRVYGQLTVIIRCHNESRTALWYYKR